MNTLYCIECKIRTPRNFADEGIYDGVYCANCASKLGYLPGRRRHPSTGSSVQPPKPRPEIVWAHNLEALKAFALGDPTDPETMLRYWKAQEAAGYPGASENVQYFTSLIENLLHPAEREARWKGAGLGDYYCSLCQHTISGRTKFCPECGAKMDEWEGV